jgi:transmembrane sensor
MTYNKHIYQLLKKHLSNTLSVAEENELSLLLHNEANFTAINAVLTQLLEEQSAATNLDVSRWDGQIAAILNIDKGIKAEINSRPAVYRNRFLNQPWVRYAAAAILTGAVCAFMLLLVNKKQSVQITKAEKQLPQDVLPGGNKAIIKLANGQIILLDSVANGAIVLQGNMKLLKLANGQIKYSVNTDGPDSTEQLFNTMTTPRGGQYQLTLSDGTVVWLNSASSITFPTAFTGAERNVSIEGEAYFEVAKNKTKPFHVKVKDADVQVLGTHFNINAYEDEEGLKATLLEGSVKISKGSLLAAILKPNEQAIDEYNTAQQKPLKGFTIKHIDDVNQVIAWKNGYFQFAGSNIKAVFKQLERWYDITVKYEGVIPERQFGGQIDRNAKLSEILTILRESNINITMNGRTIIVTP